MKKSWVYCGLMMALICVMGAKGYGGGDTCHKLPNRLVDTIKEDPGSAAELLRLGHYNEDLADLVNKPGCGYKGFETFPIIEAVRSGNPVLVKSLVRAGADINKADEQWGDTALHKATYYGYHEMVELLLNEGANINIKNNAGNLSVEEVEYAKNNPPRNRRRGVLYDYEKTRDIYAQYTELNSIPGVSVQKHIIKSKDGSGTGCLGRRPLGQSNGEARCGLAALLDDGPKSVIECAPGSNKQYMQRDIEPEALCTRHCNHVHKHVFRCAGEAVIDVCRPDGQSYTRYILPLRCRPRHNDVYGGCDVTPKQCVDDDITKNPDGPVYAESKQGSAAPKGEFGTSRAQ